MTSSDLRSRRRQRDRGLERLRSLTKFSVVAALGLAGLLTLLAASTIPGHPASAFGGQSSTAAQPATSPTQPDPTPQPRPPAGGSLGLGGSTPSAVTGGS
jgi:hypothetical protein